MEKYISGQKEREEGKGERYGYEKTGAMPVVMIDEEKGKTHKTWYITLYTKLFKGTGCTSQKWYVEKAPFGCKSIVSYG